MSFWNNLPKPFFVMAPLKDVTDAAFRALVAARGAPDVSWTEFVSADGLYHTRMKRRVPDAENPLMRDLAFTETERPIVAQIFSSEPAMIAYAARLAAELGFDGVDLNMGCPDRSVEKQGSGAALIKTPEIARGIIRAAKAASDLPVSVKTRIGYHKETLEAWLPAILEEDPTAVTIHLRTRKEMSKVPAHWDLMARAVEIRNRVNPGVLLIGNGDLADLDDARGKIAVSGCDGAMLGRAMFGNPWLFEDIERFRNPLANSGCAKSAHSAREKLDALIELAHRFEKLSPPKSFSILKKHIKAFAAGFDAAAELRARLMLTGSAAELERAIRDNPL
ncbi:tRNA-dihydrouridine synthase family protein [Patescibacteria group bacterium]|nr:tRNA-dihydrouridine synthase family protein [Patescibacteria group bacterium]